MPVPSFVPIIGSGFDQIAAQQAGWAGFSQRQDEDNARRAQMADQAANSWFSNLAQMQEAEARRREASDQWAAQTAQKAQSDQLGYAQAQQQMAEGKRQFDVSSGEKAKEFQWTKDYQEKQLKRDQDTTADYAEHLQPLVDTAGKELQAAQQEHDAAIEEFSMRLSKAATASDFPKGDKAFFSNTTKQYELSPQAARLGLKFTPEEEASVARVNNELGGINSRYLLAAKKLDLAKAEWHLREGEAQKWNLVPLKKGNTWLLRSPQLGKTFGQMVEEAAKAERPDDAMTHEPFIPNPAAPEIGMSPVAAGVLSGLSSGFMGATTGAQIPPVMTPRFIPMGGIRTGTTPPAPSPVPTSGGLPMVTTQSQYDALPPGAVYIGKDGRKYQKPNAGA